MAFVIKEHETFTPYRVRQVEKDASDDQIKEYIMNVQIYNLTTRDLHSLKADLEILGTNSKLYQRMLPFVNQYI